ncbi:carbamoyltransferase HypF [Lysinibacillus sp. BW-2-10]|uniref:carbamoyltransferase HypF n=1 Tax=Lysinibacillus sp. BW-2-10 TaxID=2590030 RepID=UPI00117FDECB|nr:carbamoyltransferase HypF [Lysinibacillus sp. BW-2-10]TSI09707.1 carbamoyltransferase HypF [Lysinibacillus sp. BW-2-10]
MYQALNIIVKGKVQGVGFRPFVYALSKKYNLKGTVQNNIESVSIMIEGEEEQLSKMINELNMNPPKLAKITEIKTQKIMLKNYQDFTIIQSSVDKQISSPTIPQDAAICEHCLEELRDPQNRRFHYPFINCTQCGPRYSIIHRFPYDRPYTTMAKFQMCPACQDEYENPQNRRHHAQPVCCIHCGPTLKLLNSKEELIADNLNAISKTAELLKHGKIVAIKGIGGYHLACDAKQEKVIDLLRKRKRRPQKPLAIMAKSLEWAQQICDVSPTEEELLTSSAGTIVLLHRKFENTLPHNIAPGLTSMGIMLPYTPIHYLLFEGTELEYLVMTSANTSGFPISYNDSDHENIRGLCDYLLTHDREIAHPIEDSVVLHDGKNKVFIRRARGFAPETIESGVDVSRIIAFGGNQKNAFAIGSQKDIILSPQIGQLENEEMMNHFNEQLDAFKKWYGVDEKYIAVDMHPFYATTMLAKQHKVQTMFIQHHHAHHVSCMAEHNLTEPCLGIILDGTGYGEDGHIWGFEFLYGDAKKFRRLGHLRYTPLPGGEKAVKEPWRNAVGMLLYALKEEGKEFATKLFPEKLKELDVIEQMIRKQVNTPMAGTCGRLFDAVSAILGICTISTYEGEAAIKLSDYMNRDLIDRPTTCYPFQIIQNNEMEFELNLSAMIRQIIRNKFEQKPLIEIIHNFHQTIVESCVQMILTIIKKFPHMERNIVLSGGSFQNTYLSSKLQNRLKEEAFNVFINQNIPCHDGGLAIGQLIIAANKIAENNR